IGVACGRPAWPVPDRRAETLHPRVPHGQRRRIVVVVLCASFAVVPMLSLLHRTPPRPDVPGPEPAGPGRSARRQFSLRANRSAALLPAAPGTTAVVTDT